jgi:cob(I)alamin adenosyltransferase
MKIATKSGDKGTTGRLFGSRVKKNHPAMNAVGDIDELNAALGMLKFGIKELYGSYGLMSAAIPETDYFQFIEELQHKLTLFMGEVAAEYDKRQEYVDKYDYVKDSDLEALDAKVDELQDMKELDQKGWVLYGNSKLGAQADFASKVCRRAERSLIDLYYLEDPLRPTLVKYINRLSDFLHLLARYFDYWAAAKQMS